VGEGRRKGEEREREEKRREGERREEKEREEKKREERMLPWSFYDKGVNPIMGDPLPRPHPYLITSR
jgi:hypothetical protein